MIKKLAIALLVVGALGVAALGIAYMSLGGMDGVQQAGIRRMIAQQQTGLKSDGKLHVFTLGTGSPQSGSGRNPVANAIIAGDEFLIIDAGEGASRTMGDLFLPMQDITAIFITHWHSDHFSGMGQVLNQSWNADRNHEVQIHGPEGVERVVAGLAMMYEDDIRYRSVGHVEHNDPEYALGTPHTVTIPEGEAETVVFDRNGVVVVAFNVDHGHVKPAYGYRVEYNGKKVVISGDTVATPLMVEAARGADLLIHEALCEQMIRNAVVALGDMDLPVEADRAEAIIGYHADTIGVAKIAQEAQIGTLVLSHLIPGTPNAALNAMFTRGMREHFDGEMVVAYDGQHFEL